MKKSNQNFKIKTPEGDKVVFGTVIGMFGVDKRFNETFPELSMFAITHIPTGYLVTLEETSDFAEKICHQLISPEWQNITTMPLFIPKQCTQELNEARRSISQR